MPQLQLYLLGTPRVQLDTQTVPLNSRKGLALLAYLAVTQQVQQRNALATLLWPESGQQAARASMRRELHSITSLIGAGLITATRNEIAWAADADVWVDVAAFQGQIHRWSEHGHASTDPCEACIEALTEAAALYQDDFLAEFTLADCLEFEEWRAFQAESLRRIFADALQALVRSHEVRGELDAAVGYARRWLQTEPMHEPIHRELMRLYALAGQPNLALRQYEECVRILRDELEIAPTAATTDLYESIRTRRFPPSASEPVSRSVASPAPVLPQKEPNDSIHEPIKSQPAQDKKHASAFRHNLPTTATSFVGRQSELNAISQLLIETPGCRLLTLLGPGGIGKTRLALQVALYMVQHARNHFPDGVYFVPLASLADAAEIVRAIADGVGYTFSGIDAPQRQVESFLRTQQLLLVIDNFEHLLSGAELLSDLLAAAENISLLVTSREALNGSVEWLYPVSGLPVPTGSEALPQQESNSAVQLFLHRSQQIAGSFSFSAANADHIVRICQLVDGMPLGLELAAAWVQTLPVDEIAEEIASSLDILASDLRNIPERHRSVRAVFEQTWQRLTENEQLVLRRLSVFRNGFTRQAARQIAGASVGDLANLINHALILHKAEQYDIHELLRQFAFGHLTGAEQTAVQAAHSDFFGTLLRAQHDCLLTGREEAAMHIVAANYEDIRAAWHYLIDCIQQTAKERDARQIQEFAPVLSAFFDRRGLFREGQSTFQRAIDALTPLAADPLANIGQDVAKADTALEQLLIQLQIEHSTLDMHLGNYAQTKATLLRWLPRLQDDTLKAQRADLLSVIGRAEYRMGEYEEAQSTLRESYQLYHSLNQPTASTIPLIHLGMIHRRLKDRTAARADYQQAIRIYRAAGYDFGIARCLNNMGSTYSSVEEMPRAIALYQEANEIAHNSNNRRLVAITLSNLASCYQTLGDYGASKNHYEQCLVYFRELHEKRWQAASLNELSITLLALDDLATARTTLLESLALIREHQLLGDAMLSLATAASLLSRTGQQKLAVAIATYVIQDKRSRDDACAQSQAVLNELEKRMQAAIWEAAKFQGHSTPLPLMMEETITAIEQIQLL